MRRLLSLLLLAAPAVPAAIAATDEPPAELVWQERFDLGGHRDSVREVVVSRGLLVTDGLSWLEREPGMQRRERLTHVSAFALATGELVWRQEIATEGGWRLFVSKGTVLLIGWQDFALRIWAFDLASGEQLWEATGPAVESEASRSALVEGVLYTAGPWRPAAAPEFAVLIQARDPRSGTLLWEHRGEAGADVHVSSLAVRDGLLAVTSVERPGVDRGVIQMFDARTGEIVWQRTEDDTTFRVLNADAALCRNRLFIAGQRADRDFGLAETLVVRALGASTGDLLWERAFEGHSDTTYSPLGLECAGPSLFAAAVTGSENDSRDDLFSIWAFARQRGGTRWRHDFAGERIAGRLLKLESSTVFLRVDDELRVYNQRGGRLRWATNPFAEGSWTDVDLAHNGYLAVTAGIADGATRADAVVRVLR